MKILHVCPVPFGTPEGGIAEYINNVAKILANRHKIVVYGTNPRQKFPRIENMDGVEVKRFRHYSPSGAYLFSIELPLALRRSEFDVVHGHGYHSFPLHFCTLAKSRKLIAQTHFHGFGHTPFRNSILTLLKPLGRRTLRKAHRIIAVSNYEKVLLQKVFEFNSRKIQVIPNGLNLGEFSNLKRHKRSFRSILYVGMLQRYKGSQYLLEILPMIDDNVKLEIVGKGPLKEALIERARKLGVQDRVLFSQDLSREELLQKYADADIFAILSRYEAYSIVVAEALMAGRPCILSKTSALSEWIDEENCFGIEFPIDIKRLATLVKRVLDNGPSNINPKKWIGSKILDWKEVVSRLERVYMT